MDALDSKICHGCFCNDRKITWIIDTEKKQCFLQNLNENQILISEDDPVSLCWECDALLRRFAKFKTRARQFYTTLRNCSTQHLQNQNLTSLKSNKLFNIEINPNNKSAIEEFEIIKSENVTASVKEELVIKDCENLEVSDNNYSDDDNQLLYLLCQKEKTEKIRTKKKRKRKQKVDKTESKSELNIYTEVDLTPEEIEEERRLLALKEDYVNALFRCIPCVVSFPNVDDLRDHVSNKHDSDAPHECPICKCRFSSPISLHYHRTRHIRRLQCAACNSRFAGKRAFESHYDSEHCLKTDLEFSLNKKSLTDSNKETEFEESENRPIFKDAIAMFPCEFCDKTFRWKTSLRKHSETHRIESGQARRPYCEPCRLSFTTTSNLQKHVKSSSKHQIQLKLRKMKETLSEDNPSPEKEQARIDQIKSSINSGRQMYSCSQCDKRFQWRGNLIRHLHSHKARANGELVCEPCNRTFSSIATYKQHMKISRKHVSEEDFSYMCNECGKKFANKRRLKDHVDWEHLKNYTHKCNTCQKVFKSHTSLYLHKQVVHRKDNAEHLCDHCGKPFPNRGKLRCHIKALHSTEAAYSCSICGARFSWHSCLSRHVRRVHKARNDKSVA